MVTSLEILGFLCPKLLGFPADRLVVADDEQVVARRLDREGSTLTLAVARDNPGAVYWTVEKGRGTKVVEALLDPARNDFLTLGKRISSGRRGGIFKEWVLNRLFYRTPPSLPLQQDRHLFEAGELRDITMSTERQTYLTRSLELIHEDQGTDGRNKSERVFFGDGQMSGSQEAAVEVIDHSALSVSTGGYVGERIPCSVEAEGLALKLERVPRRLLGLKPGSQVAANIPLFGAPPVGEAVEAEQVLGALYTAANELTVAVKGAVTVFDWKAVTFLLPLALLFFLPNQDQTS